MYAAQDSSADWITAPVTGGSFQILPWRQSASDVLWFFRCKIDRTSCAACYTDEGKIDSNEETTVHVHVHALKATDSQLATRVENMAITSSFGD